MKHPDVTLALIAGGQGRRLGGLPKGLLVFEGRTLVSRQLELAELVAEVLLVADEPGPYAGLGVRSVPDLVPGRGAPGGVHAALVEARTPWVLGLACDMPFVTSRVVERLLSERQEGLDAVLFEVGGRPEPLLAAYHARLAGPWGRTLEHTSPSFRELLSRSPCRLLPEEALRAADPSLRAVVSINTPEDLERFGLCFGAGAGTMASRT